ncbi:MAG: UvrD-helicase domain-containing protein [Rikenellaceae bacterium]|nr:UvrD-helicase domain-containing protein [Rikenellaceae bacterium]
MGTVKILRASAGSGKTYRLAYEYVRSVVGNPALYRHILAVTFTNKATEEMKQRIISEINLLASGAASPYLADLVRDLGLDAATVRNRALAVRTAILHDYSRFMVVTIDKFFQRIIRSFIRELGIDLNFNLELQTDPLLDAAADGLIDRIAVDDRLRRWIVRFVEEKIDENRRWDIKGELTDLGRELFSEQYKAVAAAGTLSRDELGRIVSEATARSRRVTDAIRAHAADAIRIMQQHGLGIEDFAYGRAGVAGFIEKAAAGAPDEPGRRVADALASDEKWATRSAARRADILAVVPQLRPHLEEIVRSLNDNRRLLNTTALLRDNFRSFGLLADLSEQVAELCRTQNIMPISETNAILSRLIAGNDTPFIFEKAGNHFSRYMIDEFQDTSGMQWQNFVPLLHNAVAQTDRDAVLLVGDVKQSIYRWRGGDWKILGTQAEGEFRDVLRDSLDTNYRSRHNIVAFNNALIARCVADDSASLDRRLADAADQGYISTAMQTELTGLLDRAYEGHAQHPRAEDHTGYIRVTEYATPADEADRHPEVIGLVEELQQRGYAPQEIAILVRYNREGIGVANALLDHKSRHPESPFCYDVVTQDALTIGSSPVAGYIMACLRLVLNPRDAIHTALYNQWHGHLVGDPLPPADRDFLRSLRTLPLEEAFEQILVRDRLGERPDDVAYIQALHEQVIAYTSRNVADIPLFVKWWDETGRTQSINLPSGSRAITIISVHKAKGLQYKAVIIPFCDWELAPKSRTLIWADCLRNSGDTTFSALPAMPVRYKNSAGESWFAGPYYEELVLSHIDNINTFYVAATRAADELHIMIPRRRSHEGRISGLILGSLSADGERTSLGELQGTAATAAAATTYAFGPLPVQPAPALSAAPTAACYPTRPIGARVRFRLDSSRYFDGGETAGTLTPRNYGIIMHKVFEQIGSLDEIEAALRQIRHSGLISDDEAAHVRAMIDRALADPVIRNWFSAGWQVVRNESDIILPGGAGQRRPDRVMLAPGRAVVVDYKFGTRRDARHRRQIEEYAHLLRGMGYSSVEGYLWYVTDNQVDQVV